MTRVKLNLASGSVQEREIVTAFNFEGVKYVIFDGESTGSMGLPIILVGKESFGKVVGITDAEEWKNTKECLKKIISGEKVDYASVASELKADDIYYRQLTLPIASFDVLKSSYVAPAQDVNTTSVADQSPVFEPIAPEEIVGGNIQNPEPVAPAMFNTPMPDMNPVSPQIEPQVNSAPVEPAIENKTIEEPTNQEQPAIVDNKYEELKREFLTQAEEIFNNIYEKLNH